MSNGLYYVSGKRWVEDSLPRKRWIATLLCLFLGVLGAHKFYEHKKMWGFIYMFTLGLCFVGIFVDFVAILSGPKIYYVEVSQKSKKGKRRNR